MECYHEGGSVLSSLRGLAHLILTATLRGKYYHHPIGQMKQVRPRKLSKGILTPARGWAAQGIASLSHERENQGPGNTRVMPRSLANQSWGGAWGMGLRARLGPQPLPPAALSFLSPGNSKSTLSLPSPEAMATAVLRGPCPGRGTPSTSPTASNGVPTNQAQGTVYYHEMPKISCQNEAVMVSSSVTK